MSMLGLTIDYGPYGWVDDFNPRWTPNTTDAHQRRYAFGNQPAVGLWNVERLGVALRPLLQNDAALEFALDEYERTFTTENAARFAAKVGLPAGEATSTLVNELFAWMQKEETDFTVFFRGLSKVVVSPTAPVELPAVVREAFNGAPSEAHVSAGLEWVRRWWHSTRAQGDAQALAMQLDAVNPKYVLRNYLAQQAIDAAHEGELSELHTLFEVMRRPFEEQPEHARFALKRPEWARSKPGCSALSCSS
jgi:uncharacterized protein YdiU (UPF0061 family)